MGTNRNYSTNKWWRKHYVSLPLLLLLVLASFLFINAAFYTIPNGGTKEKIGFGLRRRKMPLKVVDATLSNFDVVFDKFKSEAPKYKANFILFLADIDPSTNLSWCPDCVRAEPVIYKKLEESPSDVALLRAYVGNRPTWRNPQHPWRVDSKFKLKGVPTLVLLGEDNEIKGRLEDHEAHVERKIDALVANK